MQKRRLTPILGLIAALAAALDLSLAAPSTVFSPIRVSGDSPFARCEVGGSGTVYGNAEAEPSVAVNPADTSNVVGTWQQDRWSGGAARGNVAAYSFDGGRMWNAAPLPFASCAPNGLGYQRASDPWVSFGPDGTAYAAALALGQSGSAVVVATSSDGGRSWGNVREVIADGSDPRRFFNDKPSVTAGPRTPGVAYVAWDRVEAGGAEAEAERRPRAPRAPAYFSKTEDGGGSWSEPRAITSPNDGQALGNQVVVDPGTGAIYDFFDLIGPAGEGRLAFRVAFVKSTDGGATWSEPRIVAEMRVAPVSVPNSRAEVRAGGVIPSASIDPKSGRLYVAWMDSRFADGRYPEIAMSTSGDGGETWSAPVRVNTPVGRAAFTPAVAVAAGGAVAVTFYTLRAQSPGEPALPADYRVTFSTDGGASFGGEVRIAGPFDVLSAPDSGGYFLGDYQGLAAAGDVFVSLFVQANSGDTANRTDVWASLVSPE